MDDIIEDILEYELQGWKEVVLTWVNLTAWGLDSTNDIGKSRFAELLSALLEKTEIPRIRISSLWPEFITDEVLDLLKHTRIYPHFHYSVQSGSSKTLKSMHRHYNWDHMRMLLEKTKKIKREDWVEVSIGADLIVWFPGESQEDFMDTYNLVKDWLITKVHAFPFSAHNMWESVPAGKFPDQVDEKIKKERMWEIMNISDQVRDNFIDRNIWKEFQVLIESVIIEDGKTKWKGWTQNYIEADEKTFEITSGKIERNQIVTWILI
jgi:tRNA A37 methylthiotransferase MiaB